MPAYGRRSSFLFQIDTSQVTDLLMYVSFVVLSWCRAVVAPFLWSLSLDQGLKPFHSKRRVITGTPATQLPTTTVQSLPNWRPAEHWGGGDTGQVINWLHILLLGYLFIGPALNLAIRFAVSRTVSHMRTHKIWNLIDVITFAGSRLCR